MTRKEQILRTVQKQADNVTFDRMIYLLSVMKAVESGLEEMARGEFIDHDELFDELLSKHAPDHTGLEPPRKKRSETNSGVHRAGVTKKRGKVRPRIAKEGR